MSKLTVAVFLVVVSVIPALFNSCGNAEFFARGKDSVANDGNNGSGTGSSSGSPMITFEMKPFGIQRIHRVCLTSIEIKESDGAGGMIPHTIPLTPSIREIHFAGSLLGQFPVPFGTHVVVQFKLSAACPGMPGVSIEVNNGQGQFTRSEDRSIFFRGSFTSPDPIYTGILFDPEDLIDQLEDVNSDPASWPPLDTDSGVFAGK